jgi:hypothetical protein
VGVDYSLRMVNTEPALDSVTSEMFLGGARKALRAVGLRGQELADETESLAYALAEVARVRCAEVQS